MIRGGAIGDFILTLPVLSALRRQLPKTRLELLGYSRIAELALAGGLADEVRSIEARPLAGFFARDGNLDEALQEYFASFAIIISYLYDPDGIFQSNVGRYSKAQFIAGPHRPNEQAGLHATDVFLRPLERLAIFDADPVPRLHVRQASHLSPKAQKLAKEDRRDACPTLAVHPGSGSERKNWPEAKWAEFLQELIRSTSMQLLLVGGEAEESRLSRLSRALPSSRILLAANLPLVEVAERLSACTGFVGHDSGITHLAAAIGLPLLVLWADSAEAVWRPQAEKLTLLKNQKGLHEISVARVLEEVAPMLATSTPPCSRSGSRSWRGFARLL